MIGRILGVVAGFALLGAGGCGDNTRACGEGTEDQGGTCVPVAGQPPTCTDGTILNPASNTCVIDPASCQDGTVLIDHQCQDPTAGLFPDVQEGAEPNGFGLGGEASVTPAGIFTLKAIGGPGTILHGTITARPDHDDDGQLESDYDTYLVDVTGPTLLGITADGVHGLTAGFFAVTGADRLENWIRFGVNLTGDTTKRQLYLPSAGRYAIVIADSRSLVLGTAVGDANTQYYVTIDQLALPAPEVLTLTAGAVTATALLGSEDTRFFSVPMGLGLNEISLTTEVSTATGGLVVSVGGAAVGTAEETKSSSGSTAARLTEGGIDPADTTLIVVDPQINTASAPTSFELRVTTHDAVPLSPSGGTATRSNRTTAPGALGDLAAFYFDATAAGELVGVDLAWSTPVDGVLFDEHGEIASAFSWDPQFGNAFGLFAGFGSFTWSGYRGVIRAPAPGRYYLAVYDPFGAVGDPLIATSTLTTLTATPLGFGTPLTAVPTTALRAVAVDYAGDLQAWQRFTLAASVSSGGASAQLYDAETTAGRLGTLVLDDQLGGGPTTDPGDGVPLVSLGATAGSTGFGARILLGQPQHLLGVITTTASSGTFDLGVAAQSYVDEGTRQSGVISHAAESVDPVTGRKLYLLRTAPANLVTVTVHPAAGLDAEIASLDADESTRSFANAGAAGVDESLTIIADARGYVAIQVSAVSGVASYDLTINVAAPYYTSHAGTSAWANACTGGTDVTPIDRDDGFTPAIAIPTGFDFFGTPSLAIKISTNGWFTFDVATPIGAAASRNEQALPSAAAPNGLVAAYWDDLTDVRICTKQLGTRFVIQWRGVLYAAPGTTVAVQAILDTADDSIELITAPYMEARGTSASVGVENATGSQGTTLVYRAATVAPGTATRLMHP